jgi:aromatic ring-opening dioxygenase catalytic subunit (LigB family)
MSESGTRMPVYFISHGGPFSAVDDTTAHFKFLQQWGIQVKELNPKAMVILSAHWECDSVAVRTTEKNNLLYDFYNFPDELYKLQYNSSGSVELANRIITVLNEAGLPTTTETKRGLDHGVWVPLYVSLKNPEFPIVQVSLISTTNKSPLEAFQANYKLGQALQPLRSEGVLIIGSGSSTHSLREIRNYLQSGITATYTHEFENNLSKIVTLSPEERKSAAIEELSKLPCLRQAHPSLEYLVPFHVSLGAAGDDDCEQIFDDRIGSIANSAFIFGKLK